MACRKEGIVEDLFRDLLQQAPGFMAIATGGEHLIQFANDAYLSLVGDRHVVGKPLFEGIPELEGQGVFELIEAAYSSRKRLARGALPLRLARGAAKEVETRYVDIAFQPIRRKNMPLGILIEGYDVTEHRAAKEELVALRSELIHLSRVGAMNAMVATLTHELNQPLTAIKAYVAGARRCLDQGSQGLANARTALIDAGASTMRVAKIIKHLRKMISRGEPDLEAGDLRLIVREAMSLASIGLEVEGVLTLLDAAETVPVAVDKVQIQQVVINLLHNAVAATMACERREIRVRVSRLANSALLEVDDSGTGLGPGTAEDIFAPFFTTKAAGLGLGLAISRTIVEAHNGKIWADDSSLGGARFNVRLPLAVI